MLTQTKYLGQSYISTIETDCTYHGQWWLLNDPSKKIYGVLNLKVEGGIKLSLLGSFSTDLEINELTTHEIILGNLIPGGGRVTLLHSIEFERRDSLNSNDGVVATTQKFQARHLIFDYHATSLNSVKFKSFTFGSTYLVDFIRPQLIKRNFKSTESIITTAAAREIGLEYLGSQISFSSRADCISREDHTDSVTEHSWIRIILDTDITIEEFQKRFQEPLLNLIQFGTTYLNSTTFLKGYVEIQDDRDSGRKIISSEGFKTINRSKGRILHDRLFGLDQVPNPEILIKTWLHLHEQHKHIFDLYFSSLQIDRQFIVSKFLNVIQAIESYHFEKERAGKYPLLKEASKAFKQSRDSIINEIEHQSLKAWLKEKLRYNTHLRVRLNDLISDALESFEPIIHNLDIFVSRVLCSRNYYTHYNPALKSKSATGEELVAMTYVLRLLLNIHLMIECGMDKKLCRDLVSKHYLYTSVASLVRDEKLWRA